MKCKESDEPSDWGEKDDKSYGPPWHTAIGFPSWIDRYRNHDDDDDD